MNERFWIKMLHLFDGRLTFALMRNDAIKPGAYARFERESDLGWFVTLHAGRYFLNVDWA